MSAQPEDTVEFLKKKMIPLILPSGKLQALMLKLGNENEAVWKTCLRGP
jgi:hypothetical protein